MKEPKLLEALYKISRSMHTLNLEELLHLILEGVTQTLGFDRARLYLYDEIQQTLELKMAVGMKKEQIENIVIPVGKVKSVIAQALLEKNPIVIKDAEKDPRVHQGLSKLFNLKSFAAVPLMARGKAKGVISADHLYSQEEITKEKVEALMMFAHEAGLAIENAAIYQQLQHKSFKLEDQVHSTSKDLHQTLEYLERSEKLAALGQLAAGVAHEIRNPLTSIKILIHSLVNENKKEERKKDSQVITYEIEKIEKIVRDFLEFGRLRQPKLTRVDVCQVLQATKQLLDHKLKKNKIQLISKFEKNKIFAIADKEQLGQVFLNLLQNAVEAIQKKGTITALIGVQEDEVEIRVQDSGPGIPKKIMERVFEPFSTSKEEGVGLGLSIVHRIIDSFGGTIHAENNEGKGACFIVRLRERKK